MLFKIRNHVQSLTIILFLFVVGNGFAQNSNVSINKKNPLRLFVIGNSFSRNATNYLPDLVREGGEELILEKAQIGGGPLQRHWEAVERSEKNPNDDKAKIYNGKSLKELLGQGVWDIVTIQQYSYHSTDPQTYRPYAQKLYSYIKKLQPKAVVLLHQTWAYRSDSKNFGQIKLGKQAKNQQQMWEASRAAYYQIGDELGVKVIPTGDAFWLMSKNNNWSYKADTMVNIGMITPPVLPDQSNSLHVGYYWAKTELRFDDRHANVAGCYLGSLVWYGYLFNKEPKKVRFIPEGLSVEFARQLQKAASKSLKKVKK